MEEFPVITMDLFTTLARAAAVLPEKHLTDGVDLRPRLTGRPKGQSRTLYWHFPHYRAGGINPFSAIRKGPMKLIRFYDEDRYELYDLQKDPYEQNDLAERETARVNELKSDLEKWLKEVGAKMPRPNPAYKP